MTACPYCIEDIRDGAEVCRFCGAWRDSDETWHQHYDTPQSQDVARLRQLLNFLVVLTMILIIAAMVRGL